VAGCSAVFSGAHGHRLDRLGRARGRLGGTLTSIDTLTPHGLFHTPPYLHDGSAATLRDVLTTRNPSDEHGVTGTLTPAELDDLVAYLMALDGRRDPRRPRTNIIID
jgi:hypothetical protein